MKNESYVVSHKKWSNSNGSDRTRNLQGTCTIITMLKTFWHEIQIIRKNYFILDCKRVKDKTLKKVMCVFGTRPEAIKMIVSIVLRKF